MRDQFRLPSFAEQDLTERGFSVSAVLRQARLPEDFFKKENVYATTAEFFALWRAIGRLSPEPAIGLKMAADERMQRYLPNAMAAVCSASLEDALQRMGRYKKLTCPEELRVHLARDEAIVESVFLESDEAHPDGLVDLTMSCILSVASRGTAGKARPIRLELTRKDQHRKLLETHFKCPVKFRAKRNALVFRRSDLNLPFVSHNPELLEAITAQLNTDLKANTHADLRSNIKQGLRRALAGRSPSLRLAAKELGMGVRTLQRRMRSEGFGFKQIVEETRREVALHQLKEGSVGLSEIAFLLGYENANSFFRAFRRWQGIPPGEWRKRQRGESYDTSSDPEAEESGGLLPQTLAAHVTRH